MAAGGPFLTLVMRCCMRPRMMGRAIMSVLSLEDPDVEVVLIPDFKARGVRWANEQFGRHVDRVDGRYVYTLDDDSRLVNPRMVGILKEAARSDPGLVMVRSRRPALQPRVLPKDSVWGRRDRLRVASTNGGCFVSRADVWREHARRYGDRGSGDWNYLNAVRRDKQVAFKWVPVVMKEAQQLGRGSVEPDCPRAWFRMVTSRFGFEQVTPGDWRLRLWTMSKQEVRALRMRKRKAAARKTAVVPPSAGSEPREAERAPAEPAARRAPAPDVIPSSTRQMFKKTPTKHALLSRGRRPAGAR